MRQLTQAVGASVGAADAASSPSRILGGHASIDAALEVALAPVRHIVQEGHVQSLQRHAEVRSVNERTHIGEMVQKIPLCACAHAHRHTD